MKLLDLLFHYMEKSIYNVSNKTTKVMIKDGLMPWWDDDYLYIAEDVYVTYKYSKILNATCDYFLETNYKYDTDLSDTHIVKIGDSLEYSDSITFQENISDTKEHISTLCWEVFAKSKMGIELGASIDVINISGNKSFEYGGSFSNTNTFATTHEISYSKGRIKSFKINGEKNAFYRWESRAAFNMYTTYHFKAKFHKEQSKRTWNAIYYDIINEEYELKDIYSFTEMIEATGYEGQIKYEMQSDGKFAYADDKQHPDTILYI